MTAATKAAPAAADRKVVPLTLPKPERKHVPGHRERFWIVPFFNKTGTQSWRVTGSNRAGKQIRENFADLKAAQCRQVELMTEWLGHQAETQIRATKLTDMQLRLAESAFLQLGADSELLLAVGHWLKHGKEKAVAESPRLDEAVEKFKAWLDGAKDEHGNGICTLREFSRRDLRTRVNVFANSIGNLRVADITSDIVQGFLGKLRVSAVTKNSYRRNLSGFFSWCKKSPRRWLRFNPCAEVEIEQEEMHAPKVLTVVQAKALLEASEPKGLGIYVALCLFGGLRPHEAQRLSLQQFNLPDKEIRLEAAQSKVKRARVVTICPTLAAWLKAHRNEPLLPSQWKRRFKEAKAEVGLRPWTPDIMRHTAISHYFRHCGSYGQTAEWAGNSESVIKQHYQGRVSSEDTKAFYALLPKKGGRK
jgi:integrase